MWWSRPWTAAQQTGDASTSRLSLSSRRCRSAVRRARLVTINRSVRGAGESEGHGEGGEVDETGRRPRTGGGGAEVHHAGVVHQRQALRARRRPGRLHAAGKQRREILRAVCKICGGRNGKNHMDSFVTACRSLNFRGPRSGGGGDRPKRPTSESV